MEATVCNRLASFLQHSSLESHSGCVCVRVCVSFAPLYCRVLFHGVDGPQLTHSLGCFQFGSSHVKRLWAFVCKLLCELHLLGSTITGSCGSCMFSSLKNCQTAPQSGCTTVPPHLQWVSEWASQPTGFAPASPAPGVATAFYWPILIGVWQYLTVRTSFNLHLFPWWFIMLSVIMWSIFSCAYLPSVYPLWWNVFSCLLSIFYWDSLFSILEVSFESSYIIETLVLCWIYCL